MPWTCWTNGYHASAGAVLFILGATKQQRGAPKLLGRKAPNSDCNECATLFGGTVGFLWRLHQQRAVTHVACVGNSEQHGPAQPPFHQKMQVCMTIDGEPLLLL